MYRNTKKNTFLSRHPKLFLFVLLMYSLLSLPISLYTIGFFNPTPPTKQPEPKKPKPPKKEKIDLSDIIFGLSNHEGEFNLEDDDRQIFMNKEKTTLKINNFSNSFVFSKSNFIFPSWETWNKLETLSLKNVNLISLNIWSLKNLKILNIENNDNFETLYLTENQQKNLTIKKPNHNFVYETPIQLQKFYDELPLEKRELRNSDEPFVGSAVFNRVFPYAHLMVLQDYYDASLVPKLTILQDLPNVGPYGYKAYYFNFKVEEVVFAPKKIWERINVSDQFPKPNTIIITKKLTIKFLLVFFEKLF